MNLLRLNNVFRPMHVVQVLANQSL